MKKQLHRILIILCSCFFLKATAQNYIPNPSFENYSTCPTNIDQLSKAIPWYDPNGSCSDYFNSCTSQPSIGVPSNADGYQNARSGNAYAGFAVFAMTFTAREYIQMPLIDTLTSSVVYHVSFYVSPAEILKYTIDKVGAYFSTTSVTCSPGCSCILNYLPQVENPSGNIITDTAGWTLISGTFTATGGEKYMTIGNFNTDSNTHYAVINSGSTYTAAYFYVDDVSVYPDSITTSNDFKTENNKFNVYPNPNEGKFNLMISGLGNLKMQKIFIYNVFGEEVFAEERILKNETEIDVSNLPAGMYFVRVSDEHKRTYNKKMIIKK